MPKRYHVKIKSMPPRLEPIPAFCAIEINKCLHCRNCAKYTACVYNIYRKRTFDPAEIADTGDHDCAGCFRCIQECKANILTRVRNSRYDALGNEYWTPALIEQIWKQAENGKIPVSGAGYRGPFCGPGFDQMWTDMSEIVRPTRDGIHGREYISTLIELGRRPDRLEFDMGGKLLTEPPPFVEIPIPIILELSPVGVVSNSVREAVITAAAALKTLAVVNYDDVQETPAEYRRNLAVKYDPSRHSLPDVEGVPILEFAYSGKVMDEVAAVKVQNAGTVTSIRLPLDEHAAERASGLARAGAEVIHLQANPKGRGYGKREGDFITRLVREVHLRLVEDSTREQVTILISGGIAMAEHVAKAVVCGANLVGIDLVLHVALECRVCKRCAHGLSCPVAIEA
ncbi:MAG: glutamate synthase-related protein, partial [Dehalococcoidia bacterium]|nr:glutamate synthase-related protein [Dehalococcoidia bacterium]